MKILYDNSEAAIYSFGIFIIAALLWYSFKRRKTDSRRFAHENALGKIAYRRPFWCEVVGAVALCVAWMMLTWGLMEPKGNPASAATEEKEEVVQGMKRPFHNVILAVDVSPSMAVEDVRTGMPRLAFATEVVEEIVRSLDGQHVALYTFTSSFEEVVPPTLDYMYARLMARNITYEYGGTDLVGIIKGITEKYPSAHDTITSLVVISDGDDTGLENAGEGEVYLRGALSKIPMKNPYTYYVSSVGVGAQQGGVVPGVKYKGESVVSKLEETMLQAAAAWGRGEYYASRGSSSLAIAQRITATLQERDRAVMGKPHEMRLKNGEAVAYDLYYQIPLAIAVLGLVIEMLCTYKFHLFKKRA
jgi:Ca-activated chloride channel homolog